MRKVIEETIRARVARMPDVMIAEDDGRFFVGVPGDETVRLRLRDFSVTQDVRIGDVSLNDVEERVEEAVAVLHYHRVEKALADLEQIARAAMPEALEHGSRPQIAKLGGVLAALLPVHE